MSGQARTARSLRGDLFAALALLGAISLPFIFRIAGGKSSLSLPLEHDVGFQWIPFRAFIERSFDAGVFPLWSPDVFAGYPFAAFSHAGVFYPLGFLLNLFDYSRAVNLFYPLHLLVAGFGVYALVRRLGLGPAAAWLASISYALCGKPFYFIHFLPATCSNAWTPWLLFAAASFIKRPRGGYLLIAAAAFAMQVLGGDVESTSYGLLFSALFLIALGRREEFKLRFAPLLIAALFAGAMIAFVQLVPLAELSESFVRNQGVTFEYFSQRKLSPSMIWTLLYPVKGVAGAAESPLETPRFHLGALTLVLAAFAVKYKPRPESRPLGLLALLALVWSFGSIPFVDRLQFSLPMLGRFGSPEFAFFMGQLFIAILAAQGFTILAGEKETKKALPIAAALSIFMMTRALSTVFGIELLSAGWVLLAACVVLSAVLFIAGKKGWRIAPAYLAGFAVAFQLIDLFVPAMRYAPANDHEAFEYRPWLAEIAGKVRADNSRYIVVTRMGASDPDLLYHAGMALDMPSVDGWITTPLRDYAEVVALADKRAVIFKDGKLDRLGLNYDLRDGGFIDAPSMPILDLLSLRYIINRGLVLKFSTPVFLPLGRPDFYRREIRGGAESGHGLIDAISPGRGKGGDSLWIPANTQLRYRVHVSDGDHIGFYHSFPYHRKGPSADYRIGLRIVGGGREVDLSRDGWRSFPFDESIQHPQPKAIDVSDFAGKTVDLIFETSAPEAGTDAEVQLNWLSVINRRKPIQAIKNYYVEGEKLLLYENAEALPRAFVVHNWTLETDGEPALSWLEKTGRSVLMLSKMVVVVRDPSEYMGGAGAAAGLVKESDSAALVSRRPGEEIYEVTSAEDGLLFVSDQFYPGWRAYVRGREKPIFRADHCFRAVPVPAGKSVVRMVYAPASFRVGLWVSLVSAAFAAAAAILLAARAIRGRRKNKS